MYPEDMVRAALDLARIGYPVFPIWSKDKRPATLHGCKDASTNKSDIINMFNYREGLGIGIATGPAGLMVVDIDVKNGVDGEQAWLDLCNTYGMSVLPNTPAVKTRSGGLHIYFKGRTSNSAGKIAPAVDIRSQGGYVVVPPTTGYGWHERTPTLFEEDPIEAPDWLMALTHCSMPTSVAEGDERDSIKDGEKHDTTIRIAGCLRRLGFSEDAIYRGLVAVTNELAETPCDDDALRRRAHYAARNWKCEYAQCGKDETSNVDIHDLKMQRRKRGNV